MSLKQTIEEIVEKHLPDASHFIVDIMLAEKAYKPHLKILIDADAGLSIDTCAKLSRSVGEEIEAKDILPDAYVLEVSSPGLDYPLSSKRQYAKNIGRRLKVSLTDGKEIEGELLAVGNADILLKIKNKEKGKKATDEELNLLLDQIKKSIVLVSFK
jgi:ribosome maturation factor RimP